MPSLSDGPEHNGAQAVTGLEPSPMPAVAVRLAEFFASSGAEAHLVGGVVRDLLLGAAVNDVDIVVAGETARVGDDLARYLGGRRVRPRHDWDAVRIVLPEESSGGAGPPFVDISGRHGPIEDDLARRDFSINAMALPLDSIETWAHVIDPQGGLADLRDRTIRAVSTGALTADPARLLRAPRLAAQLGFRVDESTASEIRRRVHLVGQVAVERTRDDLMRLIACPGGTRWVRLLDELGLLSAILPELDESRGVVQPREHYYDVFNHLVETVGEVERLVSGGDEEEEDVLGVVPRLEDMEGYFGEEVSDGHSRLALLKLTGLLHDVSKPATRTIESSGRIRFLGHHSHGAKVAGGIMRRLRFSGRGTHLVELMVHNHLRPGQIAAKGEMPTGKAVFRYHRDLGPAAVDTLYLNMADYLAARGPLLGHEEWREYCALVGYILREGMRQKATEDLPKVIDGRDIMDAFSLEPGPRVGALLKAAQEALANGDVHSKAEALAYLRAGMPDAGMPPSGPASQGGSGA